MTKKEIFDTMKARREQDFLLIFRNGDMYESYFQDAEKLASIIEKQTLIIDDISTVQVEVTEISVVMDKLSKADVPFIISEVPDENGKFVLKISQEDE